MKILAIDTSSKICSVAITEDTNKIIELENDDEKTHSVKLMPMVDEAFNKSGLNLNDIDLLACSVGPGSFTGLRIGIATIKAFSDAKNLPVTSVSSLEGLAYNLIDDKTPNTKLSNTLFVSLIDAKNENVYCGLYRYYNNQLNQTTDLIAEDIHAVISKINTTLLSFSNQFNEVVFVGDGAIQYKEIIKNELDYSSIQFAEEHLNNSNSISIATAGLIKYKNGDFGYSNYLVPLYLKKPQAERELENKQK